MVENWIVKNWVAKNWSAKTFGRVPLRILLIAPFVLQTVGVVTLVGYLSYRSGQSAVESLVAQLMEQTTNRIRDRLDTSLQAQQQAVTVNLRAFDQGRLKFNDSGQLQDYLWQQINLSPLLGPTYFASEQGGQIGYMRLLSQQSVEEFEELTGETFEIGTLLLLEVRAAEPTQRKLYLVDHQGRAKKLVHVAAIDSRTTAWFLAAKAAKQQIWSPIYLCKMVPSLSINAVVPVYAAGKFQGVLTSSTPLSGISAFLSELNVSPTGQTFILERSGNLVATSTLETPNVRQGKQKSSRLSATQSQDARTRAIATQLQRQWEDLANIQTQRQFKVAIEGTLLFAQVTPYHDSHGLDWLVVTVIPESDFMAQIHANARNTLLLCGLALMIAMAAGSLTTQWIAHPILRLNTAAKQLSSGNFAPLTLTSPVVELRELTDSFAEMAHQLNTSFEELAEQKAYLAHLLEILPVGVSIHDQVGMVTYINQAAKQLVGTKQVPPESLEKLVEVYQIYRAGTDQLYPTYELPVFRALQGETVIADDVAIHHPNRTVVLGVQAVPIFKQAQVVAAIVLFEDITAQKQTEELMADYNQKLQQQVDELERLNHLKDDFLSTVSHELRTPMSSIRMATQMLEIILEKLEPSENIGHQLDQYLRILKQECQREISLIDNLLDLSRLEAEPDLLNLISIDLQSWIPAIAEPFEPQMRDRYQHFHLRIPADLPPLTTDLQYFQRILTELLQNAYKFTPTGGTIMVSLVVSSSSVPMLHIHVSNSGVEIPITERTRIFEKFYRIPSDDPWKHEGTGLGLALVLRLVKCLQGSIEAQSVENQTCFVVSLPFSLDEVKPSFAESR